MTRILDALLTSPKETFDCFDQVFLFGSSLRSDAPNDIDLLLVYECATPEQVKSAKDKMAHTLPTDLRGYNLDLTILSKTELEQTEFLTKVDHLRIKI